jgi:hypothetical protein
MNTRKKAKLINESIEKIQAGLISKEQCLMNYPDLADELQSAFSFIEIIPRITFSTADRVQRINKIKLLQKLPDRKDVVTKQLDYRYRLKNLQRRIIMTWVFIVTTIISLVTGAGAVYASNDALPGEILYPVKIWTENVQLAIAPDDIDVGLYAQFTEDRISEVEKLIQEGHSEGLGEVLAGYQERSQLLTQTMSRIQADSPDDATRLRLELEEKLQEQERRMETYILGDGSNKENSKQIQEQLRLILELNTQLRLRINEVEIVSEPDSDDEKNGKILSSNEIDLESEEETANNNKNEKISFQSNNETGKLIFDLGINGKNGVYAKINGQAYECEIVNGFASCSVGGAPQVGNGTLHDKQSNQILYNYSYEFEHAFDYRWEGEKSENGINEENNKENGNSQKNNQDSGSNKNGN